MRCGDLERYLEAFLDGRLGRSRRAVLRRHLALCGTCQARVERLRQFERDTQRRFRAPEQPGSVWEGLELDLVGSNGVVVGRRLLAAPACAARRCRATKSFDAARWRGAPPGPRSSTLRPTGGRMASRLAGALLVALALGAAYQLARGEFRAGRCRRWNRPISPTAATIPSRRSAATTPPQVGGMAVGGAWPRGSAAADPGRLRPGRCRRTPIWPTARPAC